MDDPKKVAAGAAYGTGAIVLPYLVLTEVVPSTMETGINTEHGFNSLRNTIEGTLTSQKPASKEFLEQLQKDLYDQNGVHLRSATQEKLSEKAIRIHNLKETYSDEPNHQEAVQTALIQTRDTLKELKQIETNHTVGISLGSMGLALGMFIYCGIRAAQKLYEGFTGRVFPRRD